MFSFQKCVVRIAAHWNLSSPLDPLFLETQLLTICNIKKFSPRSFHVIFSKIYRFTPTQTDIHLIFIFLNIWQAEDTEVLAHGTPFPYLVCIPFYSAIQHNKILFLFYNLVFMWHLLLIMWFMTAKCAVKGPKATKFKERMFAAFQKIVC